MPPRKSIHVSTMPRRKTDAASAKKPKRKKYQIHTAIEPEYGDALEAYMKAQRYYPDLKQVIEDALRCLLTAENFVIAAPPIE